MAEKDDLLADSHSNSNRLKNHFCQLLNVHGASDVGRLKYIGLYQPTFLPSKETRWRENYA
jgi:hypothetical protein